MTRRVCQDLKQCQLQPSSLTALWYAAQLSYSWCRPLKPRPIDFKRWPLSVGRQFNICIVTCSPLTVLSYRTLSESKQKKQRILQEIKLYVHTRMYKNCHVLLHKACRPNCTFWERNGFTISLFFDTKAHKEVDGFVHLWDEEFVDVLLLVVVSVVFTGKDRRSSAIDHCPTLAKNCSLICLLSSVPWFLVMWVYFLLFFICLSKMDAFSFFVCFIVYSIYSVSFSQFLPFSLSLFSRFFFFISIFKISSCVSFFFFPFFFIIPCSFLFFIHYLQRNLFLNMVTYLFLSTIFIPFSRCLFSIASVLIFLLFDTAFCFYFSPPFPFLYTRPSTDTFSQNCSVSKSVS